MLANLFSAEIERTADRTVKLSREATDKVYLNAVESGDIKTAQKLVDQAAKRWGAYLNNAEANEVFSQSGEVQSDFNAGAHNRSNGGADTTRNTEKIKFSRESVVEQIGSLVALHNLTEKRLNKVLDLGGFPMPSIAVTRTDIPTPISVILPW